MSETFKALLLSLGFIEYPEDNLYRLKTNDKNIGVYMLEHRTEILTGISHKIYKGVRKDYPQYSINWAEGPNEEDLKQLMMEIVNG